LLITDKVGKLSSGIEIASLTCISEEDALDRELQSTELARIMAASYPQPVIFLGYVVTKPLAKRRRLNSLYSELRLTASPAAPYEIMTVDGKVHDIDQSDWDRWCEYILYRGTFLYL
jgi:hypothetical protein